MNRDHVVLFADNEIYPISVVNPYPLSDKITKSQPVKSSVLDIFGQNVLLLSEENLHLIRHCTIRLHQTHNS